MKKLNKLYSKSLSVDPTGFLLWFYNNIDLLSLRGVVVDSIASSDNYIDIKIHSLSKEGLVLFVVIRPVASTIIIFKGFNTRLLAYEKFQQQHQSH